MSMTKIEHAGVALQEVSAQNGTEKVPIRSMHEAETGVVPSAETNS